MEAEFSSAKSSPCNSIAGVVQAAKRTLRTQSMCKNLGEPFTYFCTISDHSHLQLAQTHWAAGSPVALPPHPSGSCQWRRLSERTCPQSWGLRNPSFHVPGWNPELCHPRIWPTLLRCPPQGSLWSWRRREIIFISPAGDILIARYIHWLLFTMRRIHARCSVVVSMVTVMLH